MGQWSSGHTLSLYALQTRIARSSSVFPGRKRKERIMAYHILTVLSLIKNKHFEVPDSINFLESDIYVYIIQDYPSCGKS